MTMATFKKEDYALAIGSPKTYQSSSRVTHTFCADCGSPLGYLHPDYPDYIEIPVGIFDDPKPLVPHIHIWTSQKLPWVRICDDSLQRERD